jgi:hypothetical protein
MGSTVETSIQSICNNTQGTKVCFSEAFTGKRTESQEIILKCETVFTAQSRTYCDDKTKLTFTINLLEHEAYEWVKPAFLAPYDKTPEWVQSWVAFRKDFFKVFSDVDIKELSYQRLQALKQTGSTSNYANEFRRHSLLHVGHTIVHRKTSRQLTILVDTAGSTHPHGSVTP